MLWASDRALNLKWNILKHKEVKSVIRFWKALNLIDALYIHLAGVWAIY